MSSQQQFFETIAIQDCYLRYIIWDFQLVTIWLFFKKGSFFKKIAFFRGMIFKKEHQNSFLTFFWKFFNYFILKYSIENKTQSDHSGLRLYTSSLVWIVIILFLTLYSRVELTHMLIAEWISVKKFLAMACLIDESTLRSVILPWINHWTPSDTNLSKLRVHRL